MRTQDKIIVITMVVILTVLSLLSICHLENKVKCLQAQLDQVPEIKDIQQKLVEKGFDIKVDGHLCPSWRDRDHSQTQQAWDKALMNQYYELYNTPTGAPKRE